MSLSIPFTGDNACSTFKQTASSTSEGDAPGKATVTFTMLICVDGNISLRMEDKENSPTIIMIAISKLAATGLTANQ